VCEGLNLIKQKKTKICIPAVRLRWKPASKVERSISNAGMMLTEICAGYHIKGTREAYEQVTQT